MISILNHLRRLDWIIILSSIFLTGIGLLSIFSSSLGRGDFSSFLKQFFFFLIGLTFMFFLSFFDWRIIKNQSIVLLVLYGIGILALIGLLLFVDPIKGAKVWYRFAGISIDPIEYMKLILLILMAKYFSSRHIEMYRVRHIVFSGIYFFIPILLVFLQPNLGSAMVLLVLWIVILFISGLKTFHLLAILLSGLILFSIGWTFFIHDYQKDRVLSFISPELDPLGIGWSQLQSKIAIGNGGILGNGLGKGTQTQYLFLSEPKTDFIFAAFSEEFGIIGVFLIFLGFLVLVWRIIGVGVSSRSNFSRLFAFGFATVIIFQFFVNIGMNLGLLPIIGLPLHFVSYGGSSLILSYISLGILQSIKTHF